MKKLILIVLVLVFACKNDDDDNTPEIDKLPPATQTGAGTFGCLVNGEAFVETGTYFNCYYQFVDNEYYFALGAENDSHNILRQIILGSNSAEIESNNSYELGCYEIPHSHYGEVSFTNLMGDYFTCESEYGFLEITLLDFTNHIVSGTFEFDIEHPTTGNIIEIRNGRFDTIFTQ